LISYGELVWALGPLPPPYEDLKPNDQRLFDALEEIFHACRSSRPPLPVLPSIVVRRTEDGSLGTPGAGYFALMFPGVQDEAARTKRWQAEVRRVVACPYPKDVTPSKGVRPEEPPPLAPPRPTEPRRLPGWLVEPAVIAAIIGLVGTLLTVVATVWISSRREEPPQQRAPDRPVTIIIPKSDEPALTPPPARPVAKEEPQKLTLDEILEVLERHRQRATFGAVAGVLGRDPRSLFSGYARTPRTAWVVNKSSGLPTGTKPEDYPPGLLQSERIIDMSDDLNLWLRQHR
jgi:hypothetical protein